MQLPLTEIDRIEPLWNELKLHHHDRTTLFKEYYRMNSFAKRKAEIMSKEHAIIFTAGQVGALSGFCIASINRGIGEIDSLYVTPKSRDMGFGDALMQSAVDWLRENQVSRIRLLVGEGNENAITYYEKQGFRKRATMMELCDAP